MPRRDSGLPSAIGKLTAQSNQQYAAENHGRAEESGGGDWLLGEIHGTEMIKKDGAEELSADYRSNEGGGAESWCERRAGEDDQGAEWAADPIPPWGRAEGGGRRHGGADDEHDDNGGGNGAADGEEGGPTCVLEVGAEGGIGGGLE